jgi:hypothetical protein
MAALELLTLPCLWQPTPQFCPPAWIGEGISGCQGGWGQRLGSRSWGGYWSEAGPLAASLYELASSPA